MDIILHFQARSRVLDSVTDRSRPVRGEIIKEGVDLASRSRAPDTEIMEFLYKP